MIKILADKYLYQLSSFLPENVHIIPYDPEQGLPRQTDAVDALLVRTVTPINEETLTKLPDTLQFIGTGSAGTDHVDTELLRDRSIAFASAAGCNARSVAEYVVTALLIWADTRSKTLPDFTVGIVGAGHVGSALQCLLDRLEIPVIIYDPPRALRDTAFSSCQLKEILNADILTFHTPLTSDGSHPTRYWLDSAKLANQSYQLIINTARGGVINEQSLLEAHSEGRVQDMVIDVWENEPVFNDELARRAFIKTPHIAGYSVQAKQQASKIICDELISYFGLAPITPANHISNGKDLQLFDPHPGVTGLMAEIHPILEYQHNLSDIIGAKPSVKAYRFNKLRAEFPLRNEFSTLRLPTSVLNVYPFLQALSL